MTFPVQIHTEFWTIEIFFNKTKQKNLSTLYPGHNWADVLTCRWTPVYYSPLFLHWHLKQEMTLHIDFSQFKTEMLLFIGCYCLKYGSMSGWGYVIHVRPDLH